MIFQTYFRRTEKKKVISQTYCFRSNFKSYWLKKTDIGTIECWAHLSREPQWDDDGDLKDWGTNGAFYLGKWNGTEIIRADNFYYMNRSLQVGGERMFDKIRNDYLRI